MAQSEWNLGAVQEVRPNPLRWWRGSGIILGPPTSSMQTWAWGCHESPQCTTADFLPGKRFFYPRHDLCSHPPQGAVSWQDCFPLGQAAQSPLGLTHRKGESKQRTHCQQVRANGNSMGLKNKSLEACPETHLDAVEARWQHLLPHVPAARTNKEELLKP